MQYELQLSLQQAEALKAAILLWEQKSVKDRIAEFFQSFCDKLKAFEAVEEWHKLTVNILHECDNVLLPHCSQVESTQIIKDIGKKIYNWYQYLKHEDESLTEPVHFIDKIYWTPFGSVDKVKTFKEFCSKNYKFSVATLYKMACNFALEEDINNFWRKMSWYDQCTAHHNINGKYAKFLLMYWKCHNNDDLSNFMSYFKQATRMLKEEDIREYNYLYNQDLSIDEVMFRLSAHQGHYDSAEYFWNKFTEEQKDRNILVGARIAVLFFHFHDEQKYNWLKGYQRENYANICIFLINQMTAAQKETFFTEDTELLFLQSPFLDIPFDLKDEVLVMLLSSWPRQELFITALKDILQYVDENSVIMGTFLDTISNEMARDHKFGFSLEINEYRSLLREAWLIIPKSIKHKMRQMKNPETMVFVKNLITVEDWDTINLIFNDPAIAISRNRFIHAGKTMYEQLVVQNKFEILNQFIDTIFKSITEKILFRRSIIPDWNLMRKNLNICEKLLDWQCFTAEQKQYIKKCEISDEICDSFIVHEEYDQLDEFIKWKCITEEETKKFKDNFKNDSMTIFWLHSIWVKYRNNVALAKRKTAEFLKWMLDSEEEIAHYKREKLFNIKMDRCFVGFDQDLYEIWKEYDFFS